MAYALNPKAEITLAVYGCLPRSSVMPRELTKIILEIMNHVVFVQICFQVKSVLVCNSEDTLPNSATAEAAQGSLELTP